MGIIEQLLQQYSLETLILLLVMGGLSIKIISELWEWFYNKAKKHFSFRTQTDQDHQQMLDNFQKLSDEVTAAYEQTQTEIQQLRNDMVNFSHQMQITTERLQENSRNYIIDKHHYFCYQIKAIDDLSLQSLERRFLYYKAAGGNSFVDGLMEEIRSLPKLTLQNEALIKQIAQEKGVIE